MDSRARTQLALGLFLILIAAFLAALRFYPPLRALILPFEWPMWVVIAGGVILPHRPGSAHPACGGRGQSDEAGPAGPACHVLQTGDRSQ